MAKDEDDMMGPTKAIGDDLDISSDDTALDEMDEYNPTPDGGSS